MVTVACWLRMIIGGAIRRPRLLPQCFHLGSDLESAIVANLPPANYTAIVEGRERYDGCCSRGSLRAELRSAVWGAHAPSRAGDDALVIANFSGQALPGKGLFPVPAQVQRGEGTCLAKSSTSNRQGQEASGGFEQAVGSPWREGDGRRTRGIYAAIKPKARRGGEWRFVIAD